MPRSLDSRTRRAKNLKARVLSDAADHFTKCTILGCGQLTTRAAKQGLASALCRKHLRHRQRHGSPWCPSPAAATIKPYMAAASSFIELHREDPFVHAAKIGLEGLMDAAGPPEIASRLRGLAPDRRATIALGRLRKASIRPERLLAIAMAIHALIEEAPQVCHRTKDWRIVAVAKAAHRLSSGYHQSWEITDARGRSRRIAMHVYPRSSGRVLRYIGGSIEGECEVAIDHHLAAVLELKLARFGSHPSALDRLPSATKLGSSDR